MNSLKKTDNLRFRRILHTTTEIKRKTASNAEKISALSGLSQDSAENLPTDEQQFIAKIYDKLIELDFEENAGLLRAGPFLLNHSQCEWLCEILQRDEAALMLPEAVLQRISEMLNAPVTDSKPTAVWQKLAQAIRDKQLVDIEIQQSERAKMKEHRGIQPHKLIYDSLRCHWHVVITHNKSKRLLKLTHIRAVTNAGTANGNADVYKMTEKFIALRINSNEKWIVKRVKQAFSRFDKYVERKDGQIIIKIAYNGYNAAMESEAFEKILQTARLQARFVEVIEPIQARQRMHSTAARALGRYKAGIEPGELLASNNLSGEKR